MMGYGLGLSHMIIILFVWLGLILLAIWLIGLLFPAQKRRELSKETPSVQQLLKAHYDQGEVTSDQYQQKLKQIHHS
jgi:uncharacterized membrane protein